MTGKGELSLLQIAQLLNRPAKSIENDIQILMNCGLLEKTAEKKVIFPYDAVHVDFMLKAA